MCINCLHVYLEKTKSPQKQQPRQQPALVLAGGCNCMGKGGAETSPGLLLSAADVPGLERRLRQTQPGSTQHMPCSVSIAPAPWRGISMEHCSAMPRTPGSRSSWDITGLGRRWMERCPLAFLVTTSLPGERESFGLRQTEAAADLCPSPVRALCGPRSTSPAGTPTQRCKAPYLSRSSPFQGCFHSQELHGKDQ